MRAIAAAVVGIVVTAGSVYAGDVQLFNTGVFGQPTSQAVKLLADRQAGQAEPYVIWADVSCGKYFAGSAFYRKPVQMSEVVKAIDRLYGRFKMSSGPVWLWRVTDEGFAIQVAEEKEDEVIRVTYISFRNELCAEAAELQK